MEKRFGALVALACVSLGAPALGGLFGDNSVCGRLSRLLAYQLQEILGPAESASDPYSAEREAGDRGQQGKDETPPYDDFRTKYHSSGIWDTPELRHAYATFDLDFGAPIDVVNKQWKAYLRKSHPDQWSHDPAMKNDALQLSQAFNDAHDRIEKAWKAAAAGNDPGSTPTP